MISMELLVLFLICFPLAARSATPLPKEYISEANHCLAKLRESLNLSIPITRTLYGVVGVGYDDLQSVSRHPIFAPNFSLCETTPDGHFLIPNGMMVIPIYNTRLDRLASYYRSWEERKHQITTKKSVDAGAKFGHFKIGGSYSKEYQETKINMFDYQSSMLVTKLEYEAYTVIADLVSSRLAPTFRARIVELAEALRSNIGVKADYLAQMIVKDYGTHILLKSKTGAIIQQEVYIDSSTEFSSKASLATTRAAAGADFLANVAIGVHAQSTKQVSDSDKMNLSAITTHTFLRATGGPSVERLVGGEPNSSNSFAVDNLVSSEGEGLPLSEIILLEHFPEFDYPTIMKLRKIVDRATESYYQHNVIKGCTDPNAANWNFKANVEDGTCAPNNNTYPFGGLYQLCEVLPERPGSSYEQSYDHPTDCVDGKKNPPGADSCGHMTPQYRCDELSQRNLYTGDFTCPEFYTPVKIARVVHTFPDRVEAHKQKTCHRRFFKKHCSEREWQVTYKDQVALTSYYCIHDKNSTFPLPVNSGTMFGGLFKNGAVNPFTNSQGCPGHYQKYLLTDDTIVCLSEDYELDAKFSIPFNGFFSCQTPDSEKKCANGYSQHLATVSDNCEIFYCVRPDIFKALVPPVINPPPYIDSDRAQSNTSYSVIRVYENDTLILRAPIITVINAIIPKASHDAGKNLDDNSRVIFSTEQIVAAVSHFKSNTFSVLNRISANDSSYDTYLLNFSADDVDMYYDPDQDIYSFVDPPLPVDLNKTDIVN